MLNAESNPFAWITNNCAKCCALIGVSPQLMNNFLFLLFRARLQIVCAGDVCRYMYDCRICRYGISSYSTDTVFNFFVVSRLSLIAIHQQQLRILESYTHGMSND